MDPRESVDALAYIDRFPSVLARLNSSSSVGVLLSRAAQMAVTDLGFHRGVVATLTTTAVGCAQSDALCDEASDRLRRRLRAAPVALVAGSVEAELIRTAGESAGIEPLPSPLAVELGLDHHAFGLVAPADRPVALLVLDRSHPEVTSLDRALVSAFAATLAVALEHVILHARVAELGAEMRYLTENARALTTEFREADLTLPSDRSHRQAFPPVEVAGRDGPEGLRPMLTEREADVAVLLAIGRSNREIAAEVFLSAETVKGHVTRILRKLGAANRVEAASHIARLTGGDA